MMIRNMFADDINRNIGGVVRVDQDDTHVILQEVNEYVITRELRRHFAAFFNYYSEAFQTPTDDIGVWISGFFGSGKSHFLKMLSYLLENREIDGTRTVERFRAKFADDPATFMNIDASTRGKTETILFNIDAEGPINKDKTAVLRVFAKMFYNHLGFYGENLKVAKLEQFIAKRGKTDDFRRCFAERTGTEWLDSRDAFVFFEDDIVAALVETLGMSETAARNWFDGSEDVDMSITRLVTEIKEYLDTKPKNFRLLFMVDEVGQYVGTDTNLLLNLQTLVEKIGSECGGHVWVVCTGQEAIDEIIRVRADEFSRIQARFKTRLSLSSSSVDEVIQKRIQNEPILYRAYYTLAITTGLRRRELCALQWRDITGACELTVRRSRSCASGQIVESDTKNHRERIVTIPLGIWELLMALRQQQVLHSGVPDREQSIFTDPDGHVPHPDTFTRHLRRLYRQCGLSEDYHLHTLRHFYATYLLQEGTRKQVAASLLGHADTAFLERTYCHPQDVAKRQAANLMQDLLNNQNPCYVAFMKKKNRKVKKVG